MTCILACEQRIRYAVVGIRRRQVHDLPEIPDPVVTECVAAGVQVFNGRGHGHGFYTQSLGGKISKLVSFTATVTLKPDCTGTHTATDATGTARYTDQYGLPSGIFYLASNTCGNG
jgi:hypothetical protein